MKMEYITISFENEPPIRVKRDVAEYSKLIKTMLEDSEDNNINIIRYKRFIILKVLEFCDHQINSTEVITRLGRPAISNDFTKHYLETGNKWYVEYMMKPLLIDEKATVLLSDNQFQYLAELMDCSNYLDIEDLKQFCASFYGVNIFNLSREEMIEKFGIIPVKKEEEIIEEDEENDEEKSEEESEENEEDDEEDDDDDDDDEESEQSED